jgi:hypothetical protein
MQQGKPSIHVKLILCILEQLSALKTYFHQSEIFCFVKAKEDEYQYKSRSIHFRYTGVLISYRKLRNSLWYPMEGRFERKLGWWKGKMLSYEDHFILRCSLN